MFQDRGAAECRKMYSVLLLMLLAQYTVADEIGLKSARPTSSSRRSRSSLLSSPSRLAVRSAHESTQPSQCNNSRTIPDGLVQSRTMTTAVFCHQYRRLAHSQIADVVEATHLGALPSCCASWEDTIQTLEEERLKSARARTVVTFLPIICLEHVVANSQSWLWTLSASLACQLV